MEEFLCCLEQGAAHALALTPWLSTPADDASKAPPTGDDAGCGGGHAAIDRMPCLALHICHACRSLPESLRSVPILLGVLDAVHHTRASARSDIGCGC